MILLEIQCQRFPGSKITVRHQSKPNGVLLIIMAHSSFRDYVSTYKSTTKTYTLPYTPSPILPAACTQLLACSCFHPAACTQRLSLSCLQSVACTKHLQSSTEIFTYLACARFCFYHLSGLCGARELEIVTNKHCGSIVYKSRVIKSPQF